LAFSALVLLGGSNAVAVRFSNLELAPFWGAATRFLVAALIFWIILVARRVSLPRGRALIGTLLYGAIAIGASYAFVYWGILNVQASLAVIILALGPLLTMFFAIAHRLEPFRWRGLAGALIALAGIILAVGRELGRSVPIPSLVALVVGAACIAEGSVVFKLFPKTNPVATNAIATTTGGSILILASVFAGEQRSLPTTQATWAAFTYLVLVGSVLLFYLYLFILSRWTASATSYSFLLFPIATVLIAAWLAHESVTLAFVLGGVIVLFGVWVGALSKPRTPALIREAKLAAAEGQNPPCPGCA
jgi:drug/metabolite transporter (DMT)-like permease